MDIESEKQIKYNDNINNSQILLTMIKKIRNKYRKIPYLGQHKIYMKINQYDAKTFSMTVLMMIHITYKYGFEISCIFINIFVIDQTHK